MTLETWIAFVLASAAVVLIPGPNVVITVTAALRHGKRSGLATIPGVVGGAFVAMSVSLAGAGAILAASVTLFSILKVVGALYLFWIAYQLWTAPAECQRENDDVVQDTLSQLFRQSFLISALNPKGPVFYIAFVPQFVAGGASEFQQFAILMVTFLCVAALNSLMWLFGADNLRVVLSGATAQHIFNRCGASCLFVAGIYTLKVSRSS